MWRIHGLLGRVVGRCYGNNPLRLSQGHHVEDEVLNTSSVLSSSRHPSDSNSWAGEDGEQKRRRRTSRYCNAGLPRYTALDAVGWGAAAVLFMQICRRIHSQFSSVPAEPSPGPYREAELLHKCGYRMLLDILSRKDILPRGVNVNCLTGGGLEGPSSTSNSSHTTQPPVQSEQADVATARSSASSPSEELLKSEEDGTGFQHTQEHNNQSTSRENALSESAENLRRVEESSIPIILNIIGIESAHSGDARTAFSCFLAAAQHGYPKAQFNVGVCYEKGRGVGRDLQKAAEFYKQAAAAGHGQAQYRYAKLLLHCRGQQGAGGTASAVVLLEKAATSGVREAQAYLGVFFSQEQGRDWPKAVHYLRLAADNGDVTSQLYLGQCYEHGFGVAPSLRTAMLLYQRAAIGGSQQAQDVLNTCYKEKGAHVRADSPLRPVRSAPCFSISDRLWVRLCSSRGRSGKDLGSIPYCWSAESLRSHSHPSEVAESQEVRKTHLVLNVAPCRWSIGVG